MNERLDYQEQISDLQTGTFRSWDNVQKMRAMAESP